MAPREVFVLRCADASPLFSCSSARVPRRYTMHGVQGTADRAVALAREHLLRSEAASRIHDVQRDPRFQHRGVDLLWELSDGTVRGVEVKGDRHAHRGTYFFELLSNAEKESP